MIQGPRVSVVIPAYNVEQYVRECLDSILQQTYTDFEIVVVDDGSTDRTAIVAAGYGERLRLIRQSNQGLPAARNAGILAAQGELVALLDGDDVWLPAFLDSLIGLYDGRGGDCVVFCDAYMWDGHNPPSRVWDADSAALFDEGDPLLSVVLGCPIPANAVIVPRRLLLEAGLFYQVSGEDMNMWKRLALMGVRFYKNPVPLVLYRVRPGSISHSRGSGRAARENLVTALRRIARDETMPAHVRAAAHRRTARLHPQFAWLAIQSLLNGDFEEARASWLAALRLRPWNLAYRLGVLAARIAPRQSRAAMKRLHYLRRRLRSDRAISTIPG